MGLFVNTHPASAAHSAVYLRYATSENRFRPFLLVPVNKISYRNGYKSPAALLTHLHGNHLLGQLLLWPHSAPGAAALLVSLTLTNKMKTLLRVRLEVLLLTDLSLHHWYNWTCFVLCNHRKTNGCTD